MTGTRGKNIRKKIFKYLFKKKRKRKLKTFLHNNAKITMLALTSYYRYKQWRNKYL